MPDTELRTALDTVELEAVGSNGTDKITVTLYGDRGVAWTKGSKTRVLTGISPDVMVLIRALVALEVVT